MRVQTWIMAGLIGCTPQADPAAPLSPPVSPVDPETRIRSLLNACLELQAKKELTREDLRRLHALTKELAEATWVGRSSVEAALTIARHFLGDASARERLEFAFLQRPDAGGFVMEIRDGRKVTRREKIVYFLDPSFSKEIAHRIIGEKDPRFRRLLWAVLSKHSGAPDWQPHLEPAELGALLALWKDLDINSGKAVISERQALLWSIGPYQPSNDEVRRFLTDLALDLPHPSELRLAALGELGRGEPAGWRLDLAESLLEKDSDPLVRRGALDLVKVWFGGAVDTPLKRRSFDLLGRVARRDASSEVRANAAGMVLEYDDPKALAEVAEILKGEEDAGARASILKSFRWSAIFLEQRDNLHAAQDLAARIFHEDPEDAVRRAAIGAYLDLIWRTLWTGDESGTSLDPRAIESIETMAAAIQKKELSRPTKDFIRQKLEKNFEQKIPGLADFGEYERLKRYLEK